jgi:hypothetical protein
MRNLELPAQMRPCLRIFIASLLDESTATARHLFNEKDLPSLGRAKNPCTIAFSADHLCDHRENIKPTLTNSIQGGFHVSSLLNRVSSFSLRAAHSWISRLRSPSGKC